MNPIRKLAGQTAIYGFSTIIGRLLNYLLVPIYTRVFFPEEFGVFTVIYSYVGFLMVLYTYGFETAYFRYSEKSKNYNRVFSTSFFSILVSSLIFSGFLITASNSIAGWIGYPQHPEYIIWFALILAFDALTVIPFARIRQKNRPVKFAAFKLVNIITNIGLNLFFLIICPWALKNTDSALLHHWINMVYNPGIGVGYIFIANLVASALTFLLAAREILIHKIDFDRQLWKDMIKYSYPLLIVGLAYITNEHLDKILLKYYLSDAEVGIYGACYKLAILITLFNQAYRYAAEPFFFSIAEDKDAKVTYARSMIYFVIAGCIIFLGVMLYMDLAKYFIGKRFHAGLNVVPILLIANLFLGIYYNLSVWYKLTDKTMTGALIAVSGAIITIVFNVLLIPILGYTGSAWTTLICYCSMVIISYFLGRKFYPIDYEIRKIFTLIGSAILLFLLDQYLLSVFEFQELMTKLFFNTIFLILFGVIVWFLEKSSISKQEGGNYT